MDAVTTAAAVNIGTVTTSVLFLLVLGYCCEIPCFGITTAGARRGMLLMTLMLLQNCCK